MDSLEKRLADLERRNHALIENGMSNHPLTALPSSQCTLKLTHHRQHGEWPHRPNRHHHARL